MALSRLPLLAAALLALAVVGALPAPAGAADDAAHAARLAAHYRLQRPQGAGPFPAVALVPGCGGFATEPGRARYDAARQRLVDVGFVTLRVDFLAAAGVASCGVLPLDGAARDVLRAVAHLRALAFVKADAVNVLAWSWGGAAALRALAAGPGPAAAPVAAVAAFYPVCRTAAPWSTVVPVLLLTGAADDIAPARDCADLLARLPPSARTTLHTYPGARHGFDNPRLPARLRWGFGTLGYDAPAAQAAWRALLAFLQR